MKKFFVSLMCAVQLLCVGTNVYAGACAPESEAGNQRKIDGPANIRVQPDSKSKIIASLPDRSLVTIVSSKSFAKNGGPGDDVVWYEVEWQDSSAKRIGWTHEQNIICD